MPRGSGENIGFPELHTQLRIGNRLKAAELKATLGQQELVRLLAGTGATHTEIADILGTTPATVANAVQRLKRRTKAAANGAPSETVDGDLFPGGTDG